MNYFFNHMSFQKFYRHFTNKPIKVITIAFLVFLLLIPLFVTLGQVLPGNDRLRVNKNSTSDIITPPGESPVGTPCIVYNNTATTDYFVPFKTATEWMAFKGASSLIQGLSVSCGASGCPYSSCSFKYPHPTSCTQEYSCSQFVFGYHNGNCIFWPQYGEFRDLNGIVSCCALLEPTGCVEPYCSEQDIPGGGVSCTGGIDYNFCSSANNQGECTGSLRGPYCSFYCADTLCETDYGNVWYDPDYQYCCSPGHISQPLVCYWQNDGGPSVYNRCDYAPPPWFAECTYAQ